MPVPVPNADRGTLLRQPLHTSSRVPRLLAHPLSANPHAAPPQHALREAPTTQKYSRQNFPLLRLEAAKNLGCPTNRWYAKLPDTSGSDAPPSPRSPRWYSRSPRRWSRPCRSSEVVSSQGRFIAERTARGAAGPGHGRRAGRSASLPSSSRPPSHWAPAGAAPAAARSRSSRLFPTPQPSPAARAGAKARPSLSRAGGAPRPPPARKAPARSAGHRLPGGQRDLGLAEAEGGAALANAGRGARA